MFRNEILWLKTKIFSCSKFFNRLSYTVLTRRQIRYAVRRVSVYLRPIRVLGFAITVLVLLRFTIQNIGTNQEVEEGTHVLKKILEQYDLTRQAFLAMLDATGSRKLKAYQNNLMNRLNTRRILQIIEKERSDIASLKDRQCDMIKPDCPLQPPNLRGRLPVKTWIAQERKKMLKQQPNYTYHRHGSKWSPKYCTSRHSVAIIVPYRNRIHQLHLLLQHLPSTLKRQQISYKIFVVEQVGNKTFNKGILMNVGFLTALTRPAHGVVYHCFIFHDADLMTEDDRNMYTCPEFPRHLSVAVDELDYMLPYQELVGGVFAIRTDHFIQLNGYSNLYWGWGGEDDDMGLRVERTLKWKMRPAEELGRFTTIPHVKQTPFLSLRIRHHLLKTAKKRYLKDGLNSLKFTLKGIVERKQFTHVLVDVGNPPTDFRQLVYLGNSPGNECSKKGNTKEETTIIKRMFQKLKLWKQLHQHIRRGHHHAVRRTHE